MWPETIVPLPLEIEYVDKLTGSNDCNTRSRHRFGEFLWLRAKAENDILGDTAALTL